MPTVLVVDDEESLRQYMARVLEDDGHKVILAANGLEALHVFERHSPSIHLVVSDVSMPLMTGPELAAHLAEHHSAPPLLFVSGGHNRPDLARPVLKKPFLPIELCEMVRLVLLRGPEQTRVLEGCG
jgi:CheY-like chemotaxis protein